MVYVDKPKPSKGYVSFNIILCLALEVYILILPIIFFTFTNPILKPFYFDLWNTFYLIWNTYPIILFGIFIYRVYNIEYRIEDGKLWMKIGRLREDWVSLDEIKGIEKVEFIRGNWRLSFHNKSYCNRFKNGIGIITEKSTIWRFQNSGGIITEKITIWVSPEDSERFLSELGLKTSR